MVSVNISTPTNLLELPVPFEEVIPPLLAYERKLTPHNAAVPGPDLLEWEGDALLEAVISLKISMDKGEYDLLTELRTSVVSGSQMAMVSKNLGLDKYAQIPSTFTRVTERRPENMVLGDLLELYVAVVYERIGFVPMSEWLISVYSPIIEEASHNYVKQSARKLRAKQYWAESTICDITPAVNASLSCRLLPDVDAVRDHISFSLSSVYTKMPELIFPEELPYSYPPPLPVPHDDSARQRYKDLITQALTDLSWQQHSNRDIPTNIKLQYLGDSLKRAAITVLVMRSRSHVGSANLTVLRDKLLDGDLWVALSVLYDVHLHVRSSGTIRRPRLVKNAFVSVLAAVFHCMGWDDLMRWLEALLNPWIMALARNTKKKRLRGKRGGASRPTVQHRQSGTLGYLCQDVKSHRAEWRETRGVKGRHGIER